MGEVDLFDMLMSLYKLDHKSCKWYSRIFFWVFNVAIVNGWILYRRHSTQKGTPCKNRLDILEFTASTSESFVIEEKLPPLLARKGHGRLVRFSQHAGNDEEDKDENQNEEQHANTKKKRKLTIVNLSGQYDNIGQFPAHEELKRKTEMHKVQL